MRRVSCVSAAIDWAKQGQQKSLERDKDTGQFTIPANIAGMGEPVAKDESNPPPNEADGPAFFTQEERAALSDSSIRTVRTSDRYEKAGLGPEVRSGAISGAEAERKVGALKTPKPPSQIQKLKMQLEAKTMECEDCQTERVSANDVHQRELRGSQGSGVGIPPRARVSGKRA